MPCCARYKITAAFLSLLVAALPALGRVTVRCNDGSPCPLPRQVAAVPAVPAADHACCQVPVEQPAECPQHLAPIPPKCVVELAPVDLNAERQQAALTALSPLAVLPEASFVLLAEEVRWSVIPAAGESPPCCLAPGQGHSPRAPPCA